MKSFQVRISTDLIYWFTQTKWVFIAFGVAAVLLLFPPPAGLSVAGYRTMIIFIMSLILIITEPMPLPGIAFIMIIAQVYFGIGDSNSVAKAFMNDAVFFIMGSLMLAVAIIKQGWDARIALGIIRLTGNSTRRIAFGFAGLSAIGGSFIGQHTVAAIMLPIAMTLIRYTKADKEQVRNLSALLLFSIAYGSIIGSIGTPSGGARNAIMLIYWRDFGVTPLSYGQWMMYAYPLVLLQLPILSWVLWRNFIPEVMMMDSGVRKLKIQVARAGKITGGEILAAVIFAGIFLSWILFSASVGIGIIALTGVVIYLLTGLVKWEDMNRHVNWGVIVLFGATISLGTQIKVTGAADWMSQLVLNALGGMNGGLGYSLDFINISLTTLLANMVSSSSTVAVLGPVVLNFPGDPIHAGMLNAIASAFGYFTAVAAPACTIVYASGLLRARDFMKVGWKMGLISIILTFVYANLYWVLL
ncbi:MAG: DASS family sodium-coupled anion symporter [FCB group bacterium]|nr:DASS family sodium-coupled anion symporter [FCB group bacterium]